MNNKAKFWLVMLRVALGWVFLYAGFTKIIDPKWSAAGFLNAAQTFPGLFHWFAQPAVLPIINFINAWGLTLLGISLILGAFLRLSTMLGILLMALYYFGHLQGLHPDANDLIVDDHIVYIISLALLYTAHAGRYWGVDRFIHGRQG